MPTLQTIALTFSLLASAVAQPEGPPSSVTNQPFTGPLTLRDALDRALEHNLDLRIERIRLEGTEWEVSAARAEFLPAFTSSGGYTKRKNPVDSSILEQTIGLEVEGAQFDAGVEQKISSGATLGLSTQLFDWQKTNSSLSRLNPEYNGSLNLTLRQPLLQGFGPAFTLAPLRIAKLDIGRAEQERRSQILTVLRNSELAYWNIAAAERALEIRHASKKLALRSVDEAQKREELGLATKVDVLQAKAALAERHEAVVQAQQQYDDSKDALFLLLGILREEQPSDLELDTVPPVPTLDPDPFASFQVSLENSPLLSAQDRLLAQRKIALTRAKRARLPQLDLAATTGILARDGNQDRVYRQLEDRDAYFYDFRLELRIPWGLQESRARYQQARLDLQEEKLNEARIKNELFSEIRTACRAILAAREQIDTARLTVELNSEKVKQEEAKYSEGEATIRDVLEAQEDLEEARLRAVEARLKMVEAMSNLALLEGTLPARYGMEWSELEAQSS